MHARQPVLLVQLSAGGLFVSAMQTPIALAQTRSVGFPFVTISASHTAAIT
jgi:hypothetical protein